jgi:hypothetical protein
MTADTYHDHPGRLSVEKAEYWHIDPEDAGLAGPFDTIEDAKADALKYLHSSVYQVREVKIVKTVTVSSTTISYDTQWSTE